MLTVCWVRIWSKNLFFKESRLIGVCLLTNRVGADGVTIADVVE